MRVNIAPAVRRTDFVDSGETDDTRTHNVANELTARDTDSNASNNYTLTYDDDGQLTDDGQSYKYVYDAFGRIRQVKNQSNTVIADYTYNGLGYRLGVRLDTDNDGDSDGSDTTFYAVYDERWRQVATFRSSDSSPKEQFVNHQAGLDGSGGASYIDTVICREKDANTAWTSASDGVLEERRYYCQNWRADVSAVLTSGGLMVEWVKYSSYGSPFGLPGGDTNSDGDCDAADVTQVGTWIAAPAYDVRGDVNLSGTLTSADTTILTNNYQGTTLGWNNLSAIGNRKGYAGYEWESQTTGYHVRHRYLRPDLGRWIRRDPLGYVDGVSLYEYGASTPIHNLDPTGEGICEDILMLDVWACRTLPWPFRSWCIDKARDWYTECRALASPTLGADAAICSTVTPVPPGVACNTYLPCDSFGGANEQCMCNCMPNTPSDNSLRACLLCMYQKLYPPAISHAVCFAKVGFPSFPTLFSCIANCTAYQIAYCVSQ